MAAEEKKDLFEKAENSSQDNLAKTLYSISPQSAVRETKRPVAENLNELRLFLSDGDLKSFQEIQGLLAAGLANPGSASEAFSKIIALAKAELIRKKMEEPSNRKTAAKEVNADILTPLTESPQKNPRTPPAALKRFIYRRANLSCEYKSPDGKVCGSRFKFEIHHRHAFAHGGTTLDPENLELLCAHHHRIESVKEFGRGRAAS